MAVARLEERAKMLTRTSHVPSWVTDGLLDWPPTRAVMNGLLS